MLLPLTEIFFHAAAICPAGDVKTADFDLSPGVDVHPVERIGAGVSVDLVEVRGRIDGFRWVQRRVRAPGQELSLDDLVHPDVLHPEFHIFVDLVLDQILHDHADREAGP